jgi:hypothetical protein
MHRRAALLIASCLCASGFAAAGEPEFVIDWYTVDGGGGNANSTEPGYALSGTIGQADASTVMSCSSDGGPTCANATYVLSGGFWAGQGMPASGGSCGDVPGCVFRDGFEFDTGF